MPPAKGIRAFTPVFEGYGWIPVFRPKMRQPYSCPAVLRADDAAFRLWIEYEPRPDGGALSGRGAARNRGSRALAVHHRAGRLWLDRAAAGRDRAWRAVAGRPARAGGDQRLREPRRRSLHPPYRSGPLPGEPQAGARLYRAPSGRGDA